MLVTLVFHFDTPIERSVYQIDKRLVYAVYANLKKCNLTYLSPYHRFGQRGIQLYFGAEIYKKLGQFREMHYICKKIWNPYFDKYNLNA